MYKPVECDNCTRPCCRKGVIKELHPEEAKFIRQSGTELELYKLRPDHTTTISKLLGRLASGLSTKPASADYKFVSDCGYMLADENGVYCSVEDEKDLPIVCQNASGSYSCRAIRYKESIDTYEDWHNWEDHTRKRKSLPVYQDSKI